MLHLRGTRAFRITVPSRAFSIIRGDARDPASYDAALGVGARASLLLCDPPYLLLDRRRRGGDAREPRAGRKIDDAIVRRFADQRAYLEFSRAWLGPALARLEPTGTAVIWTNALGRSTLLAAAAAHGWGALVDEFAWAKETLRVPRTATSTANEHALRLFEWALVLRQQPRPAPAPGDAPRLTGLAAVSPYASTTGHPHEKPLVAIEPLVRAYSRPRDLVLDPFAGSGSLLAAVRSLGRRTAGIELNAEWAREADATVSSQVT